MAGVERRESFAGKVDKILGASEKYDRATFLAGLGICFVNVPLGTLIIVGSVITFVPVHILRRKLQKRDAGKQ